jgi:thiol-disulfide isomerase/thioredoxin
MYGNYDIVGNYMSKFYNDTPYSSTQTLQQIHEKLVDLKIVSIGTEAPQIKMTDYNGNPFLLSDISNNYTLLVFWSTYCSHCTEMLPSLKKLYDLRRNNSLEILAVSFDTDKKSWQDFLKNGGYSWINYSDLKGWESDIAATYKIKGTPTFILLDKNKRVIAKPATFEELARKLTTLNLFL